MRQHSIHRWQLFKYITILRVPANCFGGQEKVAGTLPVQSPAQIRIHSGTAWVALRLAEGLRQHCVSLISRRHHHYHHHHHLSVKNLLGPFRLKFLKILCRLKFV
jgi:hypothetical protein